MVPEELKKKLSNVKKGLSMVASSEEKPLKQTIVVAPRERVSQACLAPAKKGQAPAKKGHATKKRAVQESLPVQKSKQFKPTAPDVTTKKTSYKKIVPKHMFQVEEPYDSEKFSVSDSKPAGADKTTKKTASKKRVSKPHDSDESSVSASKPAGADKTAKKIASKKRVSKQAIQLEEPSDCEDSSSSASKESSVFEKPQLAGSAISAAADNSSEHDKHDNVDVSDSEMVEVAFMTDVPDNEVTQRQRLAFNAQVFGYNTISDIFPTPPKSSTQFTNKKYSETLDIMRQIRRRCQEKGFEGIQTQL
jgi:hypothetical protein